MNKTFEKYLEENVCNYDGILDDDMYEHFEQWLGQLDVDDVIKYAEKYGALMYARGRKDEAKMINEAVKDLTNK